MKTFSGFSLKEWSNPRFFAGAVRIGVEHGGLAPHRLPDSIYDQIRDHAILAPRARCGSGIRLSFTTDATSLEFDFRFPQPSVTGFYDLSFFTDGAFRLSFGPEAPAEVFQFNWSVAEKPRRREIEIWWPLYAECHLLDIRANNGATFLFSETHSRPVLLCLGDSIMQGSFSRYPHQNYAAVLAAKLGFSLHNGGVGGAILEPIFGGFRNHFAFSAATVAFGTNDFGTQRSLAEFRRAAEELLAELRGAKSHIPLAVFTPLPRPGLLPLKIAHDIEAYRDVLRDTVKGLPNLLLVEGPALFPEANEPGATMDGLHPTGESHQIIGERLVRLLGPFFESKGR